MATRWKQLEKQCICSAARRVHGSGVARSAKILQFPEIIENHWENQGFQLADLATRNGVPGGLPARDEKLRWDSTETLEFLVFPGGPRRGNHLHTGMPVAIRAKPYGFPKTLKIVGETRFPACRAGSAQRRPKVAPSP